MALTEDQINNLKPGDPVIVHGNFWDSTEQGDIIVTCPMTYEAKLVQDQKYVNHTCCYLPEENLKYDSKRLFKKGDIVRVVERDGRRPLNHKSVTIGHTYTVKVDEDDGTVILGKTDDGYGEFVEWYYLELITPVEDTLPYYIVEKDIEFQVRMKVEDKDCLISAFRFKNIVETYRRYSNMLPSMKQAREAAEAECDRLNEEYRKEQK